MNSLHYQDIATYLYPDSLIEKVVNKNMVQDPSLMSDLIVFDEMDYTKTTYVSKEEEEIFIIGGASLYKEAMHIARQLYITFIDDTSKEADAYFPEIKKEEWKETGREDHPTDEKHLYPYSFINYSRIK